jgi:hypothetical protein
VDWEGAAPDERPGSVVVAQSLLVVRYVVSLQVPNLFQDANHPIVIHCYPA